MHTDKHEDGRRGGGESTAHRATVVPGLFSSKGRIARGRYLLDQVIALLIMPLGLIASLAIDGFSRPFGVPDNPIWSERNAQIVATLLGWPGHDWLILITILAGIWIDLCSATKRARDIGVEIRSPFFAPLHLFNPLSEANVGRLTWSPGVHGLSDADR